MRASVEKNDLEVEKELKQMDSCAVALYFIIPILMGVMGGERVKSYFISVLFGFSGLYIIAFRSFTNSFSTLELKRIARLSKKFHGYNMAWVFLFLTGFWVVKIIFSM